MRKKLQVPPKKIPVPDNNIIWIDAGKYHQGKSAEENKKRLNF